MLYSFPGKCVLMPASGRLLAISSCFPIAATFGAVPLCLGWMSESLHHSRSRLAIVFALSLVAIIECVQSLRSLSHGLLFPQSTLSYVRTLIDPTLQISSGARITLEHGKQKLQNELPVGERIEGKYPSPPKFSQTRLRPY